MISRNVDLPKRWRGVALAGAVCVLFFAMADSHGQTAGILDDMARSYKDASGAWGTTLLASANRLFMLLATIELAWSFAVWVLDKNEFQSFIAAVVRKIMWVGIFYALLLNGPTWIPAIVDSFVEAGSRAGGTESLSPTMVFTTGLDNAALMLEGIKNLTLFESIAPSIICGIAAIFIVIAFAVVAGQLLVALVESYIVISAGLIFLGFGGSHWTTDFVQKFIGYAVATGVKLFMLFLIIGIGNTQAQGWRDMLTQIGQPGTPVFTITLTVLGGSILLAFLSVQIPAMAASMLAGSPSLTAGSAAQTAGIMGAGIVGMGAAGAASTVSAAKTTGGLAAATSAAWGEAATQGMTGPARGLATLGNLGIAAGIDTGRQVADAIAPTKGGRMAEISEARAAQNTAAGGAAAPVTSVAPPPNGGETQPSPPSPPSPAGEPASPVGATPPAASAAPTSAPSNRRTTARTAPRGGGFESGFRDLQRVQPPRIPSDGAAAATVNIRFDPPHD